MKRVSKYFVMVFLCCAATSFTMAQGEGISKTDVMQANRKVFELVNRYATYSDFTQDYQKNITWFNYLFRQDNFIEVPKDLLSWYTSNTDNQDMVTLVDYKNFVATHYDELSYYEVKDAHIIRTEIKPDRINYQVEVTKVETLKKSKVTDSCKVILHITYSANDRNALITGITWSRKGAYFQSYLMAKYIVKDEKSKAIPKSVKTNEGVVLGTKPVVVNQNDYVSDVLGLNVAVLSLDSTEEGRERTYYVESKKNCFGLSADFMYGLKDVEHYLLADLGNCVFDNIKGSTMNWHVGFNYYRQLLLTNRNRLGLDLGLMLGKYHMTFGCDYQDQYIATDADNAVYNRYVFIRDYKEKTGNVSITLPVALRYDRFVSKNVSLALSIGVRGHLLIPQKTKVSFDGEYAGLYSDLFNIYMDQNGYYDYGTFENCDLDSKGNASKTIAATVFGTLGIQYFVTKSWSIDVHLMYDYLLTKALKQETGCHLSSDYNSFQSFTYFMSNLPQHYLGVNLRVKYNF